MSEQTTPDTTLLELAESVVEEHVGSGNSFSLFQMAGTVRGRKVVVSVVTHVEEHEEWPTLAAGHGTFTIH